MKLRKMALCMSTFLLAALLFPGCAQETHTPAPTEAAPVGAAPTSPTQPKPTEPVPTVPVKPESPKVTPSKSTSYDDELRLIADQVIKESYGITDLSCFEIKVDHYSKGARVTYELFIHGYPTNGEFEVTFNTNGELSSVYDYSCSQYLKYLPNATPEAVQAAAARLGADSMVALRSNAPFYYSIDQEGYLCLGTEVIVPIDPPKTTEDGMPMEGCFLDHEHRFPSVRVCHYT